VFVHGWLANANLWRKVIARLADRHRCVALELPLGAHGLAMPPGTELDPGAVGRLIVDALDALDLPPVTLVGNDSGGAYSQIATAAAPERVAALVLNACETPYDPFPPVAFAGLAAAAQAPATLRALLSALLDRAVRASPVAFGNLIKHPIDDMVSDSYVLPCLVDDGVLADASAAMRSASQRDVRAAADTLIASFAKPVVFAWAREDRFFPLDHARRYAGELANARVELVDDAYSFTPEDQPARLAELIAGALTPA
jgi:pimeloyl-ACP methyl ester carboxylesterase